MKKLLKSFGLTFCLLLLSVSISAETASKKAADIEFADILVSALYFIGVLVLIYIILTLVSKWGKKHPDKESEETKNSTEITDAEVTPENEEENKPDI